MTATRPAGPAARWRLAAGAGVVALIALVVRLIQLDHAPFIDELHHVLAAASLLEDGDLAILDGRPYTRGRLLTYMVAGLYALFGVSVELGRVPALLGGVGLVVLLFVWLRRMAGPIAGWTAALLLCFAPVSIYLSQWVRFYTLHALAFWLAVLGAYRIMGGDRRPFTMVGSVVALAVAFHFQPTTLIGVAGVGLWLVLVTGPALVRRWWASPRRVWIAAAAIVVVGGVLAAGLGTGFVERSLDRFQRVDFWATPYAGNVRFYHWLLEDQYGLLWVLWPVALLIALAKAPREAALFGSVLGVAVVAHSLAAWKAERYLFYAMPALFAVWGLALAAFVPWLRDRLREAVDRGPVRVPRPIAQAGIALVLVAAGLFAASGVDAFRISRQIMTQSDAEWTAPGGHLGERYRGEADWAAAGPRLEGVAGEVEALVASHELKAIHYLGRVDYILYAGRLIGSHESRLPEFSDFWQVGRPAISEASSLALIMDCEPSGLIVVEDHVVGWDLGVPDSTARVMVERAQPVPLPEGTGLQAFRWTGGAAAGDPRCARFPPDGTATAPDPAVHPVTPEPGQ